MAVGAGRFNLKCDGDSLAVDLFAETDLDCSASPVTTVTLPAGRLLYVDASTGVKFEELASVDEMSKPNAHLQCSGNTMVPDVLYIDAATNTISTPHPWRPSARGAAWRAYFPSCAEVRALPPHRLVPPWDAPCFAALVYMCLACSGWPPLPATSTMPASPLCVAHRCPCRALWLVRRSIRAP